MSAPTLNESDGMPDKGHCKCKFSSGGVLSKSCAWHNSMAQDAVRYRWIREQYYCPPGTLLDQAIDAAIREDTHEA